MATASFQTKLFLAALSAAVIALAVAGCSSARRCGRTDARIEQTLVAEARLAAELVAGSAVVAADSPPGSTPRPTASASCSARASPSSRPMAASSAIRRRRRGARGDGEPRDAPRGRRRDGVGLGRSQRHSDTLNIDMLYVAVPVQHPADRVRARRAAADRRSASSCSAIVNATLLALGLALLGAALIAWVLSGRIGRRVTASPTSRSATAPAI